MHLIGILYGKHTRSSVPFRCGLGFGTETRRVLIRPTDEFSAGLLDGKHTKKVKFKVYRSSHAISRQARKTFHGSLHLHYCSFFRSPHPSRVLHRNSVGARASMFKFRFGPVIPVPWLAEPRSLFSIQTSFLGRNTERADYPLDKRGPGCLLSVALPHGEA